MENSDEGGCPESDAAQGWLGIAGDLWWLGAESAMVVPLRLARLALGGKGACAEAKLMVTEKIDAHGELIGALAGGEMGSGPKAITGGVVTHYLGYVRGNRERLAGDLLSQSNRISHRPVS